MNQCSHDDGVENCQAKVAKTFNAPFGTFGLCDKHYKIYKAWAS